MYVSLSNLPSKPKEYVIDLPRLDGGLNLWDLDYRMDADQSPEMKNLIWLDGALACLDGQVWVTEEQDLGVGFTCADDLFWDFAVLHIGTKLYAVDMHDMEAETYTLTELIGDVPENRGTFFRFEEALLYKNRGGYFRIDYQEDGSLKAATVEAYSPTILINTEPTTAAGDEYQPENRLCPQKTVWYSTVQGVKEYHLPVQEVESVDKVVVDGEELTTETDYTVDLAKGIVTFTTEPTHHNPTQVNTVRITFTKENPDAYNSIMDCPYAAVYGGDQNVCVVVGGCKAQPNAYFWSGNHIVMDPGYFPFEQYNLAGDTEERITGFGKQQSMLVIFKEHSVGRAVFDTVEMASGRVMLEMPYTNINSCIGCDLPWTIQLIENNLVFCNTEQGVHLVRDSSSARENNIETLSRNVNGNEQRPGLLEKVRGSEVTTSFDDGQRYWVVAGGEAFVWDYVLSQYSDPSWFYFTNINAAAFFRKNERAFHMNGAGRITAMRRVFSDYEQGIEKVYRFAAQNMGGYDRLKDVLSVIFVVRADTNSLLNITWLSDYEERADLTPVRAFSWALAPRNLRYRYLGVTRFATAARRKPGCRHVRHFSMRLENSEPATDMSVISAQIFYRYQGRDR